MQNTIIVKIVRRDTNWVDLDNGNTYSTLWFENGKVGDVYMLTYDDNRVIKNTKRIYNEPKPDVMTLKDKVRLVLNDAIVIERMKGQYGTEISRCRCCGRTVEWWSMDCDTELVHSEGCLFPKKMQAIQDLKLWICTE